MSYRSPLQSAVRTVFLLALAGPCMAASGSDDDGQYDSMLRYRSTARHHGLYDIRAEARHFLRGEPQKRTGPWIAAGPDIRMQVPRCAVPLRSRWARKSDHTESLPGVLVSCKKTVNKSDPSWSIFIDAYVAAERKLEVQRKFPGASGDAAREREKAVSDRSPLNGWARACSALVLAIAGPCMAGGFSKADPADPLLKYRTTASLHGLYEIREEALRFLQSQPRKKTGAWVPLGPDIRAQVPLCTVPLHMRWARPSDNPEHLPGVLVICKKSIDKKAPRWTVFIATFIPAEHAAEMRRRYPDLPSQ